MKIAKLLPDRLTKALSRRSPSPLFRSALPAWLLLVCVFLPCACDGGHDNVPGQAAQLQEVVDKLAAIQVQLQQNGNHVHSHRTLSKEQLREVFQPLGVVLGQVVEQQQVDREQWVAMVADVRRLSQVVAVGVAEKEQGELEAMRARLDQIDARLREQDQRSREAKAALIQALDAASGRLDGLLKQLDATPPEPKVDGSKGTGAGKGTDEGKGEATGPDQTDENAEDSGYSFLVTFLAISVVLLVGLVVFFPNRLRPAIPQIKYTAKPDMTAAAADGSTRGSTNGGYLQGDSAAGAPDLDHVEAAEGEAQARAEAISEEHLMTEEVTALIDGGVPAVAVADVEAGDDHGPDVVRLEVPCADPETAAERIGGFLAAEPRVLLHPEPDLAPREDALVLRFYLVPAVPAEQQARIKAAIQGLAEESALSSTAPGKAGDLDNGQPAA